MEKLTYKCNSCGWEKAIPAQWGDVSPRFCGNSSCDYSLKKGKGKKSFKSHPDQLQKIMPKKQEVKKSAPDKKQPKVKKKKS